jgi:hypothetical protein
MAKTDGNHSSPAELRKEAARSREELSRTVSRLGEELNLPRKIQRSFQRQPVIWIALLGAAGLGTVLFLTRKKNTAAREPRKSAPARSNLVQAGFVLGVLRITANLLKPHLEAFLSRKIDAYSRHSREK